MNLNDKAPGFKLKGTDEKIHTLESFESAEVLAVVFSCNHCPYVKATEDRMIEIQKDYQDRGVRFVLINSNEDENYPEDSFENMILRAREKGYPFPYLRDETQETARAYGATHTPHLFVFDGQRRLRYTGAIDDNWKNPEQVKRRYLREALNALLEGKEAAEPETHAIGCTIKWKR